MIQARQKFLLHHYARAADLSEGAYRNILRDTASVSSAADERFTQRGFDRAMAALETVLFKHVAGGFVPSPIGRDRWIHSEDYWRRRVGGTDAISTRQARSIEELWSTLQRYLPPEKQHVGYLRGMLDRAMGQSTIGGPLTSDEAGRLIDALRDRLTACLSGLPVVFDDLPDAVPSCPASRR